MNNKAFSLIELSIVLIIIGLLVAGITGGQSLINNAKLKNVLTEIKEYEQAVNIFYSLKNRIPGDLNRDGRSGHNSGEEYKINDFEYPFDSESSPNGIPNAATGILAELFLEKIIDFKPAKAETNNLLQMAKNGSLPISNSFKKLFIYFEYRSPINYMKAYRDMPDNKTSLALFNIEDQYNKENAKIFEFLDRKIDDGYSFYGNMRSTCGGKNVSNGNGPYIDNESDTLNVCRNAFIILNL